MEVKEVIEILRKIKPKDQGYCNPGIELLNNRGGLAIEIAIQAIITLKAQSRYKWHNLDKTPDDLPDLGDNVEIVTYDGTHCFMFLDFCISENEFWWYSSYPYEGEEQPPYYVKAWRYIKQFEEEEQ